MNPDPERGGGQVLVDLALQGGGAHGAFTWGVLDRLLDESWLRIEGISGTSAGAMNAAILVDGYAEGEAEAAKAQLELFWQSVSRAARLLSVCGVSHRESYFDLFMVAIVGALIALAAVIVLGSAFGSF
jgi:predicted acylesterase/phospholipase RssA